MGRFEEDPEFGAAAEDERDVSAALTVGEGDVDASLRPRTLRDALASLRRGGPVDVRHLP